MAWYNSSWLKRKKIALTGGASGAQTDYSVKLAVTYDSDMKSDFSDLRFTKADGTTLIDCWLESHTASTSAIIWVETDTPANTVEADIYMYYGNSGASSSWSGANTFLFFDDFEDGLQGDWTTHDAPITYNSTGDKWAGSQSCEVGASGNTGQTYITQANSDDIAISTRVKTKTTSLGAIFHGDGSQFLYLGLQNNLLQYYSGGWQGSVTLTSDNWHKITLKNFNWSAHTFDICTDDAETVQYTGAGMHGSSSYNDQLHLYSDDLSYWDNTYVRKYCDNPATYAFGSEETELGWSNKIIGITSPGKVIGVANSAIAKIMGV